MAANRMRFRRWVVSTVLLGLVLMPAARSTRGSDGFPLSTYPMFSEPRPSTVTISHVVSIDAQGRRRVVGRSRLGTVEVMQAMMTVRRAVDADGGLELCHAVAERLRGTGPVELLVVTDTFDTIGYFDSDHEPLDSKVHGRCPVPGR